MIVTFEDSLNNLKARVQTCMKIQEKMKQSKVNDDIKNKIALVKALKEQIKIYLVRNCNYSDLILLNFGMISSKEQFKEAQILKESNIEKEKINNAINLRKTTNISNYKINSSYLNSNAHDENNKIMKNKSNLINNNNNATTNSEVLVIANALKVFENNLSVIVKRSPVISNNDNNNIQAIENSPFSVFSNLLQKDHSSYKIEFNNLYQDIKLSVGKLLERRNNLIKCNTKLSEVNKLLKRNIEFNQRELLKNKVCLNCQKQIFVVNETNLENVS